MTLPASPRFPWRGPRSGTPPPTLHLKGSSGPLSPSRWSRCELHIGRGRCRLRWFRLQGLPAAERLVALRLQVEAWRPFNKTEARLVLQGDQGLAIAWDGDALVRDVEAAGLVPERCHALPELLTRPPLTDGLHLLELGEGFEAQYWRDDQLRASRWWPESLSEGDWTAFARASGASRDVAADLLAQPPQPMRPAYSAQGWCKHQALHAGQSQDRRVEVRLVLGAAAVLALAAGSMGQQLSTAWRQAESLAVQINDLRQASAGTMARRDAALAQRAELEQLARWMSQPLPVEVMAHVADRAGRLGVQLREFELEGESLRVALQPGPNASRATLVKELQAGGWFVDVAEARSETNRNMWIFDMRLRGVLPPVMDGGAVAPAQAEPAPNPAVAPMAPMAATRAPALAAAPSVAQPAPGPRPQAPAARPPGAPPKPIIAEPDAQGLPPPAVFDAIPSR